MIVCDFCTEEIEDGAGRRLDVNDVTPAQGEPQVARFDIHPECVGPFAEAVSKVKGKRPVKS